MCSYNLTTLDTSIFDADGAGLFAINVFGSLNGHTVCLCYGTASLQMSCCLLEHGIFLNRTNIVVFQLGISLSENIGACMQWFILCCAVLQQ